MLTPIIKISGLKPTSFSHSSVISCSFMQAPHSLRNREPFRTMVLCAMCIGFRRSEFIALKWCDFNWEDRTLYIRRAVVDGVEDIVKTKYSEAPMQLDDAR
jgi:hypothetical protein